MLYILAAVVGATVIIAMLVGVLIGVLLGSPSKTSITIRREQQK